VRAGAYRFATIGPIHCFKRRFPVYTAAIGDFLGIMQLLMGLNLAAMSPELLVVEAAKGHVDNVRRILSQHPTKVCHVTTAATRYSSAWHSEQLAQTAYKLIR